MRLWIRQVAAPSRGVRVVPVLALLAAMAAGGCAEGRTEYADAADVQAPSVARAEQAEAEADGLPAQVTPMRRAKPLSDDPSEPYSPNYGGPAVQRRAEAPFVPVR